MSPKDRLSIPPQAMPEQQPDVRRHNMCEVALGYSAEQAKREASRCLNCPTKPCMQGCPVAIDIPGFLAKAAEGDFAGALEIIRRTSLLPAVCGRVCPQEKQCQKFCTVGKLLKDVNKSVAIGRVERFAADFAAANEVRMTNDELRMKEDTAIRNSSLVARTSGAKRRVAVIGSGPASITCAADCARAGFEVTMFEAFHKCGGVLVYGIPEFRLPKKIVEREIEGLKKLGVKIETNVVVGRTVQIGELLRGDKVFGPCAGGRTRRCNTISGCSSMNCTDENSGSTMAHFAEMRPRDTPPCTDRIQDKRDESDARDRSLGTGGTSGTSTAQPSPPSLQPSTFSLQPSFDAVFIGTGAGLPKFMGIEGENLLGVFSANEYLTRSNLMKAYDEEHAMTPFWHGKRVAVLGGGNVAMDAARTALRLGADEVSLVYRRSMSEMPARAEEIHHAQEEGVAFRCLQNAKRVLGDDKGHVRELECLRYELGEPDASGRRSPVEIPGSEFELAVDTVIVAVGSGSNPLIAATTSELKVDRKGHILVDEQTGMTSMPGVFAGGDIVLGAATVILAMGEGRRAAAGIKAYLKRAS